jgi:hypothetical protein
MAGVDLVAAVGAATFGVGILFSVILGDRGGGPGGGHLAWRLGTVNLLDTADQRGRSADGCSAAGQ